MTKSKARNSEGKFSNSDQKQKIIDDLLHKNNIDPQVFYSIKKMQQIPDEVILNFLNTESSLSKSNYKKRILSGTNKSK